MRCRLVVAVAFVAARGAPGISGQRLGAFPIFVIGEEPRPALFAIE